jgi:serine phosphatase RsbU (regulator of sigma subunit)
LLKLFSADLKQFADRLSFNPMTRPLWFFLSLIFLSNLVLAQSIDESIRLLNESAKAKDLTNAALYSYTAGKLFYEQGDRANAEKYLLQSVSYGKKAESITQTLLSTHLLGNVFYQKGNFGSAADQFDNAAELAKKLNSGRIEMESLLMEGKSHAALKRFKKAIDAVQSALDISLKNHFTDGQLTSYQLLAEYYKSSGNDRKASENKSLYESLVSLQENERKSAEKAAMLQRTMEQEKAQAQNKISEQSQKLQQAEMSLSFKEDSLARATQSLRIVEESLKELEELNHKRQLEIDLLNKKREVSELRIQEQNARLENEALLRNFILAVVVLTGTLIGVVVKNYRKTIKINEKLDLQNKNIKSSINYAKRIQEAMLPKNEVQEKYLKDSFILFKPRDVVSGDFYWFSTIRNGKADLTDNDLAFGAIDCTGHGVPGAFMSMIGINSLNTILSKDVTEPNHMLDSLHQEIRNALQQEVTGNNDGMDAALCVYRKHKNLLEFSGAKNPLVYIKNNSVHQIKGDIHPIGGSRSKNDLAFRKHEIIIDAPTMVYLFTDGFKDQFGGPENQKFMSKRFTQLLLEIHHLPLSEQKERLNTVFEDWKGKNDQTDDMLIIGVQLDPQPS